HRDLKPRNIMESGDGEVKILDFGVSHRMTRSMTELTGAETSGTWPYMAPEQLSNNFGRENRQVDIWAFGVTMYQLLTGEVPFRNRDQIVDLKEKPFPMRRVSKKTTHVVLKCLEKDRKKRYQSMSDVLADLEGVKTAEFKIEKITDTVEDDGEDIVRIPRERFWEWPRFAALVVVVLALLFLYYSMEMNRSPGFDPGAATSGEKTETRRAYENYFKRAEDAAARGDYSAALADLAGAKKIAGTPLLAKRTREITVQFQHRQIKTDFQQLTEFVKGPAAREEKIEKTRQFLETYRELADSGDTKDAAIQSMIVQTRDDLEHLQVRTIPFADLPEDVVSRFYERIRRIEIPGLPQGTRALGRVKIWGYVTAAGTISLQDESIDDTNLEVTGQNAADTIKRMIIRKLAAVSLGPPRDKNGVSVRVKEWEITFKVGTFQDKVILLHEE
ncbi:MAG: protein kinase, partial [bacterium]|nr:protein kinase [bacterium]